MGSDRGPEVVERAAAAGIVETPTIQPSSPSASSLSAMIAMLAAAMLHPVKNDDEVDTAEGEHESGAGST